MNILKAYSNCKKKKMDFWGAYIVLLSQIYPINFGTTWLNWPSGREVLCDTEA